jgi:hypothetical protein
VAVLYRHHALPVEQVEYDIKVQLLEIYNESIRDLLVPDIKARQQGSLQLVNTQRSGSNVPEATQVGDWEQQWRGWWNEMMTERCLSTLRRAHWPSQARQHLLFWQGNLLRMTPTDVAIILTIPLCDLRPSHHSHCAALTVPRRCRLAARKMCWR